LRAAAVEPHCLARARRLASGLADLGLPLCAGAPGADLSHIVTVGRLGRQGVRTVSDGGLADLSRRLSAAGVVYSVRREALRFSCFVYNDETDVDRVIQIAREWRREFRGAA